MSTAWLVQFGDYDLGSVIVDATDSLGTTNITITELPFTHGAIDNFGDADGYKPSAVIPVTARIVGNNPIELEAKLTAFYRGIKGGRKKLWYAPYNTRNKTQWRWTYAKAALVSETRELNRTASVEVQVSFVVTTPFWHNRPNTWYLDDGWTLDSGLVLDRDTITQSLFGGSTFTIINAGSANAYPHFRYVASGTAASNGFEFQRLDTYNNVLQSVVFSGAVASGGEVVLDFLNKRIEWSQQPDALQYLTPKHMDFYLTPGVNTIKYTGNVPSATLYWFVYDTYH